MRPTPADLEAARDRVLDDLLPDPLRLLLVGINPSLWSAAVGAHFARRGNRFYPALAAAGIVDRVIDCSAGYRTEDLAELARQGVGITNVVRRATARADELAPAEYREGVPRLERLVARHRPEVVAFLGIGAYRTAFGRPKARAGPQEERLAGSPVTVLPNPSGLNAHETVDSLAAAYRTAARCAGVPLHR